MTAPVGSFSNAQANRWLDLLSESHPETVAAVEAVVAVASPTAGPVRVLREVLAALEWCTFDLDCKARAWSNGICGPHQDAAAKAGDENAIPGVYR